MTNVVDGQKGEKRLQNKNFYWTVFWGLNSLEFHQNKILVNLQFTCNTLFFIKTLHQRDRFVHFSTLSSNILSFSFLLHPFVGTGIIKKQPTVIKFANFLALEKKREKEEEEKQQLK